MDLHVRDDAARRARVCQRQLIVTQYSLSVYSLLYSLRCTILYRHNVTLLCCLFLKKIQEQIEFDSICLHYCFVFVQYSSINSLPVRYNKNKDIIVDMPVSKSI